jgi:UDP-N-acetylmuramoylalanine--D-glutamate ligase
MNLCNQGVLVLGLGESGLAMAQWLARQGARVRVADTRAAPPYAAELARTTPAAELITGPFAVTLLEQVTLLALSPGLAQSESVVQEALRRAIPVTGEIELFAQALRELGWRDHCRIIAITGTNGKTTVTSLAGALCRSAGVNTAVAGNISPAALNELMRRVDLGDPPQVWVLELSSFQLETLQSLDPDAAVVLNVTDDHLDRYSGLDDYAAAKARIFRGRGIQVLNRDDSRVMAMAVPGRQVFTFGLDSPPTQDDFGLIEHAGEYWLARGIEPVLLLYSLPLAGRHNAANALAALALCRAVGVPMAHLARGLVSFRGLSHRVEKVADFAGVSFYDDSKGTNVGATLAALQGLGCKVALIVGGEGKGQDFTPLRSAVDRHARTVVLIGRDAPLIEDAIRGTAVPVRYARDMDEAVRTAFAAVQPGDAVLLSPACASFDMFRNYAHRAEVFVAAVRDLAAPGERSS